MLPCGTPRFRQLQSVRFSSAFIVPHGGLFVKSEFREIRRAFSEQNHECEKMQKNARNLFLFAPIYDKINTDVPRIWAEKNGGACQFGMSKCCTKG